MPNARTCNYTATTTRSHRAFDSSTDVSKKRIRRDRRPTAARATTRRAHRRGRARDDARGEHRAYQDAHARTRRRKRRARRHRASETSQDDDARVDVTSVPTNLFARAHRARRARPRRARCLGRERIRARVSRVRTDDAAGIAREEREKVARGDAPGRRDARRREGTLGVRGSSGFHPGSHPGAGDSRGVVGWMLLSPARRETGRSRTVRYRREGVSARVV